MPYQHRAALASVVALVLLTISGAAEVSELEVISSHAPLDQQAPGGWTEGPEQGARYILQVRLQKGADRFYADFRLFDAEQGRNVLDHNVEGSLDAIDLLGEIITRELMRVLELSIDTDAAP